MDYEAIVAIVERGEANGVVKKAYEAGARGATIAFGRGSGEQVLAAFHNMRIEASKEVILIIAGKDESPRIFAAVAEAAMVHEPGRGIAFTLPIGSLLGLDAGADGGTSGGEET